MDAYTEKPSVGIMYITVYTPTVGSLKWGWVLTQRWALTRDTGTGVQLLRSRAHHDKDVYPQLHESIRLTPSFFHACMCVRARTRQAVRIAHGYACTDVGVHVYICAASMSLYMYACRHALRTCSVFLE